MLGYRPWTALALVAVLGCADDPTIAPLPSDGSTMPTADADPMAPDGSVTPTADAGPYVDISPPTFASVSPAPGSVFGLADTIYVVAEITDDYSGVDPDTVVAVFGNDLGGGTIAEFPLEPSGPNNFVGSFPVSGLKASVEMLHPTGVVVFPSLSIRARDLAGNEGYFGEELVVDYTPPIISLDPPKLRDMRLDDTTGAFECSFEYDPLGDDAPIDGQTILTMGEFRVRVHDRGNTAPSSTPYGTYIAGLDEGKVQILILDQTDPSSGDGDALLVDTDDDGICDSINPNLDPAVDPSPGDALAINLEGLAPGGKMYFAADPMGYAGYANCGPPIEADTEIPRELCTSTGLQQIIPSPVVGDDFTIFTIPPASDEVCMGLPFDFVTNHFEEGWACVVARAVDEAGNIGLSRPIRVCFDANPADGPGSCPEFPSYPAGPDVTPLMEEPYVPTLAPGFDCLGTWSAGVTNAAAGCDLPPDYPAFQERRTDL